MRTTQIAIVAIVGWSIVSPLSAPPATARQEATPAATYSRENVTASGGAGTPMAMTGDMPMAEGSPMPGMNQMAMELDQMYIDMMIPHHESIIAMAQAALPRLTDERLQEMAQAIISAQGPEIEELRGYREAFYGDADPMPMDTGMMAAMAQMMPGMMDMMSGMMDTMPGMMAMMPTVRDKMPGMDEAMAGMAIMMDAQSQVAAIRGADNTDLAFIDLTIAHHQMAIESSQVVLEEATHPEIRDFAERVIAAQQREIDEVSAIRQELSGEATPASP